jgi:hypothetical protein
MRFNSRTPSPFSSAWTFSLTASVDTFRRRRRGKPTNLGADHYADRFRRRSNQ